MIFSIFRFNETIDLSNRWIYIAFFMNLFVNVAQIIINTIILKKNIQFKLLIILLYSLFFALDETCFIIAIKSSPRQFNSYNFSILTPLIILITSVICSILYAIRSLQGKHLIRVIINFIPGMITLIFIKIAFGFCYGSSLSFILIVEDFLLTILKSLLLPDRYKVLKDKLD